MYDPTNTSQAREALENLENNRLALDLNLDLSSLRIHSIKKNYSLELLTRFYNEQMIPHFPLEDERDELIDWIYCLDPLEKSNHGDIEVKGPEMDVLLLLCDAQGIEESEQPLILAGVAFEYYKEAEVGLVAYVTTQEHFQRKGIMKELHPIAVQALMQLHNYCYLKKTGSLPEHKIKAILAETNTIDAGDATETEIINRHRSLFSLGYRSVEFPYVQPPLGTEMDTFDDIILLVYQGVDQTKAWFPNWSMPSKVPFDFAADFIKSVFGYGDESTMNDMTCYKLNKWFVQKHPTSIIHTELPWIDIIGKSRKLYDEENTRPSGLVVCVIGAGIAGLSASIEMAKNATSPLTIQLIEASDMVGGRVRTIITEGNEGQYVNQELADRYKTFAPWPVPLGAEFVHGVDSIVNDIIEKNDWAVEETFDFCTSDEYPSRNSFSMRSSTKSLTTDQRNMGIVKIFGQGKCWNLQSQDDSSEQYQTLIERASQIWDKIYSIGDAVLDTETCSIPPDNNLAAFIEKEMIGSPPEDTAIVKSIIDSIYANTAGSSIFYYGVNEGCREELNWDYTESNFRTKLSFAELIQYFRSEIDHINSDSSVYHGQILIHLSTPIVAIGNANSLGEDKKKTRLSTSLGEHFDCDKAIVTVPLAILKQERIKFSGDFCLSEDKKNAIEKINMFSGMKAHVLLRKGIDVQPSIIFEATDLFFCPNQLFTQVWINRNKDINTIFLTGFVVAEARERVLSKTKDGIISASDLFLNQLHEMFKDEEGNSLFIDSNPTCSAFDLYDWSADEFVGGMYSSPSVDAGWRVAHDSDGNKIIQTCRHDMKAPIADTIFFAGEHTNVKTCATVQAALESGSIAASDVLESFGRK